MSEAGRKKWWRAVTVAVLGGVTMTGSWIGLSRSAPPDALANPLPQDGAWTRAATSISEPISDVAPAAAALPPIPSVDGSDTPRPLDPAGPGVAQPPVIPPVPATPPAELPALPALPSVPPTEPAKPSIPPIAPVVPVLPPPSIVTNSSSTSETAPPPLPSKSTGSAQPAAGGNSSSGLQVGNPGNTVKTENPGKNSGPAAPVVPVAPAAIPSPEPVKPVLPPLPGTSPVAPTLPALPAVGSPGEVTGTTVERAKPIERPLQSSEKDEFPIPNLTAPTPGDTNVNILNQSVAAAVIGGVLFAPASPAPAAPLPLPIPTRVAADDKTDLADLKTKVETATTKLTDIQKDLKTLTELLNGRRDRDGFPIETSRGLVADLKDLSDRLKKVEEDLTKMKGQSSSLRPNVPVAPDLKQAKGTVRVVNEYPVQISIVVNGTSYRVPPSKSLDVDVPAGEFTYQLLESGAASTRSVIKEKETVTLRIK